MAIWKKTTTALALVGAVFAQTSSIVSIFFPDADPGQDLVGSLIASDSSQTTIAFGCAASVSSDDCGFDGGVTLTYGLSTWIVTEAYDDTTGTVACALTGTTAAQCIQTVVGPAYMFSTDANGDLPISSDTAIYTNTQISTEVTTTTLNATDISFIAVTLTAFPSGGSGSSTSAASSGATRGAATPSATGSATGSSPGGTSPSGSHSASSASQTGGAVSPVHIHLGAAAIAVFLMGTLLL